MVYSRGILPLWPHSACFRKAPRRLVGTQHTVRITQQAHLTTSPRHRDSYTPAQAVPVGIRMEEENREGRAKNKFQREVKHNQAISNLSIKPFFVTSKMLHLNYILE